jgi:hypothetical protein
MYICTVNTCEKPIIARGLCTTHYKRWSRNGHLGVNCYKGETDVKSFLMSKCVKNGACWEWSGSLDGNGYGLSMSALPNERLVHRISWIVFNGKKIPKSDSYHGVCVLHKCDNPSCFNPDHLFLGTHKDNMADRDKKGRHMHGESHYEAKLNDNIVMDIKHKLRDGVSGTILADEYNVTQGTISHIKNGRIWKHIKINEVEK